MFCNSREKEMWFCTCSSVCRALKNDCAIMIEHGKTKCIDVKTYWRHMTYTHNVSVDVLRSVYGVKTELIERAAGGQMICMLIS